MENCRCNCKILKSQENGVSAFREKKLNLSNGNLAVQNKDFINSRQRAPLLNFIKKNGGRMGEERELGRVSMKEDKRVGDSLDLSSDTSSYSEEESLIGSEIEGKGFFQFNQPPAFKVSPIIGRVIYYRESAKEISFIDFYHNKP